MGAERIVQRIGSRLRERCRTRRRIGKQILNVVAQFRTAQKEIDAVLDALARI